MIFFYSIKNSDLHNFTDNNTISSIANNIEKNFKISEKSSEKAEFWFRNNSGIANSRSSNLLQPKVSNSKYSNCNPRVLNIDNKATDSQQSAKVLHIDTDSHSNFDAYISTCAGKHQIS